MRNALACLVTGAAALAVCIPPAAAKGPGYQFFKSDGQHKPGAYWDPCQPVRYGIDFTYARKVGMRPAWERARWQSAVAEVGQAMGVDFRYAGSIRTRSAGTIPRSASGVDLVITFGHSSGAGRYGYRRVIAGTVAGVAGIQWQSSASATRARVTSGYVVIDALDVVGQTEQWKSPFDPLPPHQRAPDVVRALYMHEFGHAVGLDHVQDKRQLMYPQLQSSRPDALGPGDRKGLRKLGNQRCF